MKASELNGTHIGQRVTAQIGKAWVCDILVGIENSADLIDVGFFGCRDEKTIGRRRVTLTFAAVGEVSAGESAEVTIHD